MLDFKNSWNDFLCEEYEKEYYQKLRKCLIFEYKKYRIYPKPTEIFNSLIATSYEDVKVVILGQDPYHQPNQAHGFCFSVRNGVKKPPSLENIFKELKSDLKIPIPENGNLKKWAKQGVLLLNTILTVREGQPNSHCNLGWSTFTDKIINELSKRNKPVIFVLWGNNAASKLNLIDKNKNYILRTSHPSPFSVRYGFNGCRHFSKINEILEKNNEKKIEWEIY